jgi:hypothetical protein
MAKLTSEIYLQELNKLQGELQSLKVNYSKDGRKRWEAPGYYGTKQDKIRKLHERYLSLNEDLDLNSVATEECETKLQVEQTQITALFNEVTRIYCPANHDPTSIKPASFTVLPVTQTTTDTTQSKATEPHTRLQTATPDQYSDEQGAQSQTLINEILGMTNTLPENNGPMDQPMPVQSNPNFTEYQPASDAVTSTRPRSQHNHFGSGGFQWPQINTKTYSGESTTKPAVQANVHAFQQEMDKNAQAIPKNNPTTSDNAHAIQQQSGHPNLNQHGLITQPNIAVDNFLSANPGFRAGDPYFFQNSDLSLSGSLHNRQEAATGSMGLYQYLAEQFSALLKAADRSITANQTVGYHHYQQRLTKSFENLERQFLKIVYQEADRIPSGEIAYIRQVMVTLSDRYEVTAYNLATEVAALQGSQSNHGAFDVRLPRLQLPEFHGEAEKFSAFKEQFSVMVKDKTNLAPQLKFSYLCNALKGPAMETISHLTMSETSFDQAWKLLLEKYDNTRLVFESNVEHMLTYPSITRTSLVDLQKFLEHMKKTLVIFDSLGYPQRDSPVIATIFRRKLDIYTRQEFEKHITDSRIIPTNSELFEFLQIHVQQMLITSGLGRSNNYQFQSQYRSSGPSRTQNADPHNDWHKTQAGKRTCVYCKEGHSVFQCPKFMQIAPAERGTWAKSKNLCLNCLTHAKEAGKPCPSTKTCLKCHTTIVTSCKIPEYI